MKYLMVTAAALGLLAGRAEAVEIPTQFIGRWCMFISMPVSAEENLTLYDRSRKGCKLAEDELTVDSRSIFVAGGDVMCKLVNITPPSKLRRLNFDCSHVNGDTYTFSAYFSRQSGRLGVQNITGE